MSNAQKVNDFLDKAKVFYLLTTDGDAPKGRPFGFHMLVDDKVYFGCGTFKNVFARSELKQEEPYKTLAEALSTDQREFNFTETKGTVVGLFCPEYMKDLNAAGWHFHFVSEDKQKGGHVLDLDIDNAELKWDNTKGFNMLLPDTKKFPTLDRTTDQSQDIKKVETNEG